MTLRIAIAGCVGALIVPLLLELCLWANRNLHFILTSTLLLGGLYVWLAAVVVGIVGGICLIGQSGRLLWGLGIVALSALSMLFYAQDFIPRQP
jgi:hypothetical protein